MCYIWQDVYYINSYFVHFFIQVINSLLLGLPFVEPFLHPAHYIQIITSPKIRHEPDMYLIR